MKSLLKNILPIALIVLLTSCGNMNEKIEEKINELSSKTEYLDSLVNKELEKVKALDTLINFESNKVKYLDSLVNKSSSRLDSFAKEKFNSYEKIVN